MFRAFIGYVVGILSTLWIIGGYASDELISSIIVVVILFIGLMFFTHKYHIRKRNEHYEKLRNGSKDWYSFKE